jgi:hypothetical protein
MTAAETRSLRSPRPILYKTFIMKRVRIIPTAPTKRILRLAAAARLPLLRLRLTRP